jgi:hypothetical protein
MRRDDVANAFRRAEGSASPDVERLVDAVPSLMAEAQSRGPASLPWWPVVPRLAVITAIAVVVAVALTLTSRGTTATTSAFERVMLGTNGSDGTGDFLLDAVLGAGRNDG